MFDLNQLKKYYTNAPSWMKNLYGSVPFDIRNGRDFRKWKKFLNENINVEEYELLKLKETLVFAYTYTEYYKELFDELDVSPYEIHERKDLAQIPTIDKNIVRNKYNKFIVKNNFQKKSFYVTTGGTSGAPMKFLQSKNVWAKEVSFIMNYFSKYGFNTNMTKASFRGGDFDNLPKNVFWKVNPHASEIHFSPFHINDDTIQFYVKELNKKSIQYFQTYPSSIKLLIEYMKKNKLKLNYQVDTVYLLSENILESDIKLIQSFFDCRISSLFGHSERLIFAPNFDSDLGSYKIDRRYGLFELLDNKENLIKENNLVGEMIGTSFDNYSMPLIRYKTGDMSNYLNKDDYIINSVEGRWKQDYLLGMNSMKIYLTALNMHSDIFKNVIKFQFVQHNIGMAELCLQVKNAFNEIDKRIILDELNKKAGHVIEFEIKIVNQFRLTHRGKFINIVKNFKS